MELSEIKVFIDRWEALFDKNYSVNKLYPEFSNLDIFFKKEIMEAASVKIADKILTDIEEVDAEFKLECEKRKSEEEAKKLDKEIKEALTDTIWSMLPDAPLSQDGKKLYREYRQYLRDIPDLWRRKQITKLEVMNFDKWRENTPVYKVEKKVIL